MIFCGIYTMLLFAVIHINFNIVHYVEGIIFLVFSWVS